MASGQKKKAKGTPKRTGKRAHKYQRYYTQIELERKLRRILRRNGRAAAAEWARNRLGALSLLQRLVA